MLMPVLGNQLISVQHVSVMIVALILNVRIILQDLLMFPAGFLCNRIGSRYSLCVAGAARGLGFVLFGCSSSTAVLLLASVLSGIGGALFFPAALVLYTEYTDDQNRMRVFAQREVFNGIGNLVGPVIGSVLLLSGFKILCIISGLIFFLSIALVLLLIPAGSKSYGQINKTKMTYKSVLCNRNFLLSAPLVMLVTVLMNQHAIALSVRIDQIAPDYRFVGIISSVSAVVIVLLQVKSMELLEKRFSIIEIIGLSIVFFMVGFTLIGWVDAIWGMYFGSVLCAVGTMIFVPAKNMLVIQYAPREYIAAYSGLYGLISTIGNTTIGTGFGAIYDLSVDSRYRYLPWVIILLMGTVTLVFAFGLRKRLSRLSMQVNKTDEVKT